MAFAATKRARFTILATVCALVGALTGFAKAGVIEDTPAFPPVPLTFTSPTGAGCFDLAGVCVTPGAFTLTSATSSFSSTGETVVAHATYAGSLTPVPPLPSVDIGSFTLTGTVDFSIPGRTSDTDVGSGTITLTALSLSGPLDIFPPYDTQSPYDVIAGHTLMATLSSGSGTLSITPIFTPIPGTGFSTETYLIDAALDVSLKVTVEGTGLQKTVPPVSVMAVPEPPGWMLMLAGFAGLGLVRGASRIAASAGRQAARLRR